MTLSLKICEPYDPHKFSIYLSPFSRCVCFKAHDTAARHMCNIATQQWVVARRRLSAAFLSQFLEKIAIIINKGSCFVKQTKERESVALFIPLLHKM